MDRDTVEKIIYYACRAPSGHNTQPWRFRVNKDSIEIHPDYSRALPIADKENRELFISLGAAVENLFLAAQNFGFKCTVNLFPQSKDFIQIEMQKAETSGNNWLKLIEKRQSNRGRYSGEPLAADSIAKLKTVALEPGVGSAFFFKPSELIKEIITLVNESSAREMSNQAFKKELLSWMRFNLNEARLTGDGLSYAVLGNPQLPNRWLGELIVNLMLTPEKENERNEPLLKSASGFVIFSVEENSKIYWVSLGRYFERLALKAAELNIAVSHYNQPFEVAGGAEKLKARLNLTGKYPCLMIRIGQAKPRPYSLRRPIDKALTFKLFV